jgi:hypothetical protein
MLDTAPTLSPEPVDPREALDPRERRAAKRLRALERLSVIGMALSEAMLARVSDAMNSGEVVDTAAVALEYSRLSRAVRQTVALEARLDVEIDVLAAKIAAERAAKQAEEERRRDERVNFNMVAVNAAVGEAIEAEAAQTGDAARTGRLNDVLSEYVNDPREEEDFADLPVSTLIERICGTLGVAVDWSLWKDEDWAVEEWREGAPGSPYASERAGATLVGSVTEPNPPPLGEGDHEVVEGASPQSQCGRIGPLSRFATAPPMGEQFGAPQSCLSR